MNLKQKIKNMGGKIAAVFPTLLKEEEGQGSINSVSEYKERIKQHRKRTLYRVIVGAGIVGVVAVGGYFLAAKWTYKTYDVVTEYRQEDEVSAQYTQFGDYVLKYGGDEISLLDRQGKALWNDPHAMNNPVVDVCQGYCVVYDKNGSEMTIFNEKGLSLIHIYCVEDPAKKEMLEALIARQIGKSVEVEMLLRKRDSHKELAEISVDDILKQAVHMDIVVEDERCV